MILRRRCSWIVGGLLSIASWIYEFPHLVMRGDIARLGRCTLICTQGEDTIKRSKPFKYAYEKEIVMCASHLSIIASHSERPFWDRYAYFKKLDYFSTECIYSPDAYRGHARAFLKDLEAARPSAIIDIIHSGEAFEVKDEVKATQKVQRTEILVLRSKAWWTWSLPFLSHRDMPEMRLYV